MKLKSMTCIAVLCGLLLSAAVCSAASYTQSIWCNSAAYVQPALLNNSGFYLGGTLGADVQYFNNRQNVTNTIGQQHVFYRSGDISTYNASGGLLFGYQQLYQRFGWGVEAKGIYNANNGNTWKYVLYSGGGFNIHHRFKIPYQFDLLFKPMLIISHSSFVYLPIGITCVRLNHLVQVFDEEAPGYELRAENTQNKFLWGFVTGLGLEKEINNKCNVFVEYNTYILDRNKFTQRVVATTPDFDGDFIFRTKQFINAIRVGMRIFIG